MKTLTGQWQLFAKSCTAMLTTKIKLPSVMIIIIPTSSFLGGRAQSDKGFAMWRTSAVYVIIGYDSKNPLRSTKAKTLDNFVRFFFFSRVYLSDISDSVWNKCNREFHSKNEKRKLLLPKVFIILNAIACALSVNQKWTHTKMARGSKNDETDTFLFRHKICPEQIVYS